MASSIPSLKELVENKILRSINANESCKLQQQIDRVCVMMNMEGFSKEVLSAATLLKSQIGNSTPEKLLFLVQKFFKIIEEEHAVRRALNQINKGLPPQENFCISFDGIENSLREDLSYGMLKGAIKTVCDPSVDNRDVNEATALAITALGDTKPQETVEAIQEFIKRLKFIDRKACWVHLLCDLVEYGEYPEQSIAIGRKICASLPEDLKEQIARSEGLNAAITKMLA